MTLPDMPRAILGPTKEGILRMALAGAIFLALVLAGFPPAAGAYLAAGILFVLGVLLVVGRLAFLRRGLASVGLDFLWISLLLGATGGNESPCFPLLLLAALGVARVREVPSAIVATATGLVAYLAVVAFSGAVLLSADTLSRAGFVVLFCAIAWTLGSTIRRLDGRVSEANSDLIAERRRAERIESLVPGFGPMLGLSNLDGMVAWTVEAARMLAGGSYAHVAELNGTYHRTFCEADSDACPSWWHSTIQRLVLWSCRDGKVLRDRGTVHGIDGFIAVPIGTKDGEKWGAIVLGGKDFDVDEERALTLLAGAVAPALAGTGDAPAGRDPVTGLPNRASLRRVLIRQLSRGRAVTVLAAGLDALREHEREHGPDAVDTLLRRVGRRMNEGHRSVFGYGEGTFVVVQGGSGGTRAREAALAIRRLVSDAAGPASVSVGFATVEPGEKDPGLAVDLAVSALAEARKRPEGIAAGRSSGSGGIGDTRVAEIILALAETAEFRGPYVGEHSKAVARIALRIGARLSLAGEEMHAVELGALLHDLGKIGIPEYILTKPDSLTDEEHEVIRRHPILGARILSPVAELAPAIPAVRHHHERFDGGGYPDALAGEDIPLAARIVSVADAFDAIVRARVYGRSASEAEAMDEIVRSSGTQFDPTVVRAFVDVVRSERRISGSAG